jgi:peptide subunit release factor 1 (eRF1)
VLVAPERLEGWIARFTARHGTITATARPEGVTLVAADGAVAECEVPFPPLTPGTGADVSADFSVEDDPVATVVAEAGRERLVGVLLVRLGGHAVGVFSGSRLLRSKVGRRYVQGRTAAGGWSQQRYARRRQAQGRSAYAAAAELAAVLLLPERDVLDAVVLGGDRRAVDQVLADERLAPLRHLVRGRLLDVPDPRQAVLERTPELFRSVRIRLLDPDPSGS